MVKPSEMIARQPPLQDHLGPGQVLRCVDSLYLALVIDAIAHHAAARADQGMDAVGEPVLAVDRGRGQPLQHGEQGIGMDHVGADVELHDLEHVRRRFPHLDDIDHSLGLVADDPAIGQRVGDDGGEQGQGRILETVPVQQAADGGGAKEGRVAVQDQDVALKVTQVGPGLQYGVPCP
jgi:hypothetical protein